jgi:hypothetical protein
VNYFTPKSRRQKPPPSSALPSTRSRRRRALELGIPQIGALELGSVQGRALEPGAAQVGVLELGPLQYKSGGSSAARASAWLRPARFTATTERWIVSPSSARQRGCLEEKMLRALSALLGTRSLDRYTYKP